MVGALLFLGYTTNAQVCNANFSYILGGSGSVNFYNSSSGAFNITTWNFGNGNSSSQNDPVAFYNNGTYPVCLTINDSVSGCTSTYCDTITITSNGCQALFTASDSAGYVTFNSQSVTSGGTVSYEWLFDDSTAYSGVNVSSVVHPYAFSGVYNVCLFLYDQTASCGDTICDSIIVTQGMGQSCFNSFTAIDYGSSVGFAPLIATYSSYYWDFGDGTYSTEKWPSHSYSLNGIYYACLTVIDSNYNCSGTTCDYVVVGNPASNYCNANFNLIQDSLNLFNYTAFCNASLGPQYTYFWDFGDGTSSTQQYPSHVYPGVGPYVLCLTVTDSSGCTSTQCDSLYAGRTSNVISLNIVQGSISSIQENELLIAFDTYPNPFNNSTNVKYTTSKEASIELSVMDVLGNQVKMIEKQQKNAGDYSIPLNLEGYSDGIYFLQLKTESVIKTKKIIVNH